MDELRVKFTKWYCRRGYHMSYKPCDYGDGVAELIFHCPWWVRPFVEWFFSPCVYYREVGYDLGDRIVEAFTDDEYDENAEL